MGSTRFPSFGTNSYGGLHILPGNPKIWALRATDLGQLKVVGKKLSAYITEVNTMTKLVDENPEIQQVIGANQSLRRAVTNGKLNKFARKRPNDSKVLAVAAQVVSTLIEDNEKFIPAEQQAFSNSQTPEGYEFMKTLASNRAIGFAVFTGCYYNSQNETKMSKLDQVTVQTDREQVSALSSATKTVMRAIGNRAETQQERKNAPTVISSTESSEIHDMLKGLKDDNNQFALQALAGRPELQSQLDKLGQQVGINWAEIVGQLSQSKATSSLSWVRGAEGTSSVDITSAVGNRQHARAM